MKTLAHLAVSGKRVLVRVDFNVPMRKGAVADDYRIMASVPTIKKLLEKGASVILIAHLGRPGGKVAKELSLAPVARRLAKLLKKKIMFAETLEDAGLLSKSLSRGDILLLENIRFWNGEERNDPAFAKKLATLGDAYVNDAFGNAHRAHASIVGIPKHLPHAAGLCLEREVRVLESVMRRPKRPFAAIVGGAKIKTKLPLLKKFISTADHVMVGGAVANTILAARAMTVGKSPIDSAIDVSWLSMTDRKLHLPVDGVMTTSLTKKTKHAVRAIADVRDNEYIADVGPSSVELFISIAKKAKTVVWNGPLGMIEIPAYAKATEQLLKYLARSSAFTVIGGGDLHRSIRKLKLEKKFSHVSTGGGAMLEFLAEKKLPGIEALK